MHLQLSTPLQSWMIGTVFVRKAILQVALVLLLNLGVAIEVLPGSCAKLLVPKQYVTKCLVAHSGA